MALVKSNICISGVLMKEWLAQTQTISEQDMFDMEIYGYDLY